MTTSGAASDEKVVNMTTFWIQCNAVHFLHARIEISTMWSKSDQTTACEIMVTLGRIHCSHFEIMFISALAYATNISIFSDILSKYFIQLHLQPFLLTQSF